MSDFEAEREATIARNRALLAQLDVSLDLPKPQPKAKNTVKAKPVQPKRPKRESVKVAVVPVRQSTRLKRSAPDPNETPERKRKREQEEEKLRQKQENERLEAEERAREAKRPRHDDLEMNALLENQKASEVMALTSTLQVTLKKAQPQKVGSQTEFIYDDEKDERAVEELKQKLKTMKIVSRAKVTQDRVYSVAYHPEVTKDLVFFGDKHGQLGIWDARAQLHTEGDDDDDDDDRPADEKEGGKYWCMQVHWPATSQSSISAIKFDPIDSHSVFTSAYDRTIRCTSFVSGISQEVYFNEATQINSFDIQPTGNILWLSDKDGYLTHLDLREHKSKARQYQLSQDKIGSVSINPVDTNFLLTASNSQALRIWDARKLHALPVKNKDSPEIEIDEIEDYAKHKDHKGLLRGEWKHNKSVSSAYWDPHGRRVVSTSYDDTIRLWDLKPDCFKKPGPFPSMRPINQFKHNFQTGKWVTILRAQWSPNPDVYPHFTIGNMDHSLDIRSCKGDLIVKLYDKSKISAIQAVSASHPSILERAVSGNGSGRCTLWAPPDDDQ